MIFSKIFFICYFEDTGKMSMQFKSDIHDSKEIMFKLDKIGIF
jgi:hypothetical protein